ncbi:ankyrin [Aspergillus eucalypticola CBS 122712]|uniref:Ankyrin n=1 Tax=Aspergillus eucalypticola (strain CBS 122712 / IBT 29274) TaxID=1448314 RepID=A0A317VI09_ASPEC|nr:ankyrin [Aspergillus eucalypticola CBS 122712]PWY72807.1 ankyrin [Aspergillus eucalypticola CBS 122712]
MSSTDRARNQEAHLPFPTSTARALELLDSISAYNHDRVQLSLAQERSPGTAEWIFESDQYKKWWNADHTSFLLCTGPIGCGKTILATFVIENLLKQSNPVFYYFCHESWEASPDAQSILRSILKQIVLFCARTRQPLSDAAVARLEEASKESTELDARELIINHLHLLTDAFLIIDGLDLLEEPHISQIRETLVTISRSSQVHRLKTALFYQTTLARGVDLSTQWKDTIQLPLSIDHLGSDIRTFVNTEVDRKQQYRKITDSALTLEWIKTELVSRGEQMFLWIVLQLDSLWTDVYSEADIRDRMNQLPRGLESTYNRCLEQIVRVKDGKQEQMAHKIMLWTLCAARQLTTAETQRLVALDDKDEEIHSEQFLNHDPTAYCANLLVLGCGGPQFTHPSVKQFLTDPSKLDPELKWEALPLKVANCRVGRLCGMFMKRYLQLVPRGRTAKTPVDVALNVMRGVLTNPFVQGIVDSPFGLKVVDASIRQKVMISIDQITHNARHVHSQAASPQPAHATDPDDFAPITHYIYQNWLFHTADMTRAEFREQFFHFCLYSDAWLPWQSEGKYEVKHLRNLIQRAISVAHNPLLYLACDQVEKMDKYNAVFGKPLASDLLPIDYTITTGNLEMVKILMLYYGRHMSLGGHFTNAVLHAARCNNSDILEYFKTVLPSILGEASTIDSLFDIIIANDNPSLLQWWLYTFPGRRQTESVRNQFLKAVLEICKTHVEKTACLIPLLEQWVRMEAASTAQTALLTRVNSISLPKDCLPVIVQVGKTSPVEITLSQLELLTPGDTDSLLDTALTLPLSNALPILQVIILHNRRKEEHWVKESILGPRDQFSRRLLPWLKQLFCAIVPENGAIITDELQASTLLQLLEVLPDEALVDLLASHCPDCQLHDRWNHNILYALAHRPTAQALQVLKARNLLPQLDLNATDDYGWGPLHVAATRGYNEVVIFLLVHGADPQRRNDRSETPAKLAEMSGATPTIAILDRWENSPIGVLHRAFMEQHATALQTHPGMEWEWALQLSVWRALDNLYAKAEDAGKPISSVTLDSVARGIRVTSPSSFPDDYSYYMRSRQMWIRQ